MTLPSGLFTLGLLVSLLWVALISAVTRVVWGRLDRPGAAGRSGGWRAAILIGIVASVMLGGAGGLPHLPVRTAVNFFSGPDLLAEDPEEVSEAGRRWVVPTVGEVRLRRVAQAGVLLREEYRFSLLLPIPLLLVLAGSWAVSSPGGGIRRPPPRP